MSLFGNKKEKERERERVFLRNAVKIMNFEHSFNSQSKQIFERRFQLSNFNLILKRICKIQTIHLVFSFFFQFQLFSRGNFFISHRHLNSYSNHRFCLVCSLIWIVLLNNFYSLSLLFRMHVSKFALIWNKTKKNHSHGLAFSRLQSLTS